MNGSKKTSNGSNFDLSAGSILDLKLKKTALSEMIVTPVYAQRFWRPVLGGMAFDLWLILRDYAQEVERTKEFPTINLIVDTLGYGSRHTVLGRRGSGNHPAQEGLFSKLEKEGIIHHNSFLWGGAVRHEFSVLDQLPLLTVEQISRLSPRKQGEHQRFLQRL